GMTLGKFRENVEERLGELAADLRGKTYRPKPVRRVYIPKAGGGQRPVGIPSVRDRIVQQALLQVLAPIFEAKFSSRSHGFRPERGCTTALQVVNRAVRHGYEWVVDADLAACFDTVDHEKLLAALNEEIADGSILTFIRRILKAGVVQPETSQIDPTEIGTPQGGPLSPRLAKNQRLQEVLRRLNRYLRGWHWYFKAVWSPYETPFRNFDMFVRRRIRTAITGRTGIGWNRHLPNALLREVGLISLDDWQRQY